MIIAHRLLGRSQIFAKLQLNSLKNRAQNSSIASTKICASSLIHYQAIAARRPASSDATGFRGIQIINKTSWMINQMKISVRFYNQKSWVVRDCKSIDEILQTASKRIDDSLPVPDAAVWSSICRMITRQRFSKHRSTDIIEHQISVLLCFTCDSLKKLKPRQLSEITLSIAKIVQNIREAYERRRVSIYHQAFGKVLQESSSNPNQGIFHALAKATDANLPDFESRDLSNTAYAYALLGYDPTINERSLLGSIAEISINYCINQFEPQGISNILWSYAKLNVHHPQLFQSVGNTVASKRDLDEFAPQALSNIVWAYATNNAHHAGLFQNVGNAVASKSDLNDFTPQHFANIVWAYAKNNTTHAGLFQKVGDGIVAMNDLRSFAPQNLAIIVWAYATSNAQHPNLFQKVGDTITSSDGSKVFTTQDLANIVWAYAKLDVKNPSLFTKIGKSIGALDDLSSFNTQALSNIAWSFAVADVDVPVAFNDVFIRALVVKQTEFNIKNLNQLYKWHIWQVEKKSSTGLPEVLRKRCERAFKNTHS
eukprot:scaffold13137_cov57-Cyclotella_meneghiniana.AAC.2